MNEAVRKQILSMTIAVRKRLYGDILQQLESTYGMNADGAFVPVAAMPTMTKNPVLARERQDLEAAVEHEQKRSPHLDQAGALVQFAREVAFTYLNRLAALRMMEARKLIQPSIGQGLESSGFKQFSGLFGLLFETKEAGYRRYLELLFDEAAVELPALFDRSLPTSIVFPSPLALKDVLEELDRPELADIWLEDETIGWIYQYFTPREERERGRKESQAPRTSQELSLRNQFYTPRYVVKFLTDNTLGKLWCEMYPDSGLRTFCTYMVGEPQIRRQPKSPEDLKILDPACGSGHFLLYVFDVLAEIYKEAGYPLIEIPTLILANNVYGVDIDLRATQIAGLALWLRSQRYLKENGIQGSARPVLRVNNLACAEPMPDDAQLLEDLMSRLESHVAFVARKVLSRMKLAGEMGSLLRVEQEIGQAVALARSQWPVSDEDAWVDMVPRTLEALHRYTQLAVDKDWTKRYLFATDAIQGVSFIRIWQQRFDVVLMNPPFGLGLKTHFAQLKTDYPDTYVDLYACFVARGMQVCCGKVGAITSRSFLTAPKLVRWRANSLVPRMEVLLDLGWPVMDDAKVHSAAYVLDAGATELSSTITVVDRRSDSTKDVGLDSVGSVSTGAHFLPRSQVQQMPNLKMLYGVPQRLIDILSSGHTVGREVLIAKLGMKTFDNARFLRLRWEVPPDQIGVGCEWEPYAKGGPFARFYADLPLLVRWSGNGSAIAEENRRVNGQTAQARQASTYYRRPGGTYSYRASDFGVRVLPAGCIIGGMGPAVFPGEGYSHEFVIGFLNSTLVNWLVNLQTAAKAYDSGIVESIPWCGVDPALYKEIAQSSRRAIEALRSVARYDECSSLFVCVPTGETLSEVSTRWSLELASAKSEESNALAVIDTCVDAMYEIDSRTLIETVSVSHDEDSETQDGENTEDDEEEKEVVTVAVTAVESAKAWLSYAVGCVFGRWDLRAILDKCLSARVPEVFAPLPQRQPGALGPSHPDGYPISITTSGILSSDPGDSFDIVQEIQKVIELVWGDNAQRLLAEAAESLGVSEIDEYYRNPRWFFTDHIQRYSQSRRKAPIYWYLQSPKKSYGLWLYYHRLTRDTLFSALRDHVEPKLILESQNLQTLKTKLDEARTASARSERTLAKQVAAQEELLRDIGAFRDELKAVADAGYDPDLNDGVLINIAPLHKLVPWKEAATCYKDLKAGKYPWSTMAKRYKFR